MAKLKSAFFCQNCGVQHSKWLGKCNSCNEWNTIVEEVVEKKTPTDKKNWTPFSKKTIKASVPIPISEITYSSEQRLRTLDNELNRVLGGGIVQGSLVLIGGEPGIGKSTLMLQIALNLPQVRVLYVSGEESIQQIKMRAERLGKNSDNCFILSETKTQKIFKQIEKLEPDILIIDSIQTLHTAFIESATGSISQVRECASELMRYAKESGVPVFLIGHINKEGNIAGPKILEHIVDTVLQFEGDRHMSYRILRTIKNRFGSTAELGIYEMLSTGLRQVSNPSEILISQREDSLSGVAISATMEGNRCLLVEVQSLVSPAAYGTAQRSSTGYDNKRLNMLLAVLEKHGNYRLGMQDVFLNITGGIKIEDPAIDLAVCMSIISSLEDMELGTDVCFAAEVGLGGEIRAVQRIENRISEAEKLGFKQIFISKYGIKGLDKSQYEIEIIPIGKLGEIISQLF